MNAIRNWNSYLKLVENFHRTTRKHSAWYVSTSLQTKHNHSEPSIAEEGEGAAEDHDGEEDTQEGERPLDLVDAVSKFSTRFGG